MSVAELAVPASTTFADVPYAQAALEELYPVGMRIRIGSRSRCMPGGVFPFPARALRVRGWMLMPDGPFERIHAFVNGEEFFTCAPERRDDLAEAFPHIPNAAFGQFCFELPRSVAQKGRMVIVGKRLGVPLGRMQFRFRYDLHRRLPTPPQHLSAHTVATRDRFFYHAGGYKAFDELNSALARHSAGSDMQRLLDWGCGCGRLTAHWLHQGRIPEIHGCDINPDGITWCRAHLRNGHFAVVKFDPPTPYANDYFDGLAAFSVFTHLTQPAQLQWLAEMHRILRPGGTFVATVHGRSAGWFRFGPSIDELLRTGIYDGTVSHGIEEIVGAGVYRDTYQAQSYTRETFGRWFDVLEYVERGAGNNQDLIVLRKSP
jgi:SAM-dependent methyltransferase